VDGDRLRYKPRMRRLASVLVLLALVAAAPLLAAEPAAPGGATQQRVGRYQVLVEGMT